MNVRLTRTTTRWPAITLTERQWDIVRDALYQRGTKQAAKVAEAIWKQGGGTAHSDGSLLGRPSEPDAGSVDQDAGPGDRAGNALNDGHDCTTCECDECQRWRYEEAGDGEQFDGPIAP